MHLDAPTLIFAQAFSAVLGGMFLLLYWWQDRDARAAFWWGAANILLGAGIALITLHSMVPPFAGVLLGSGLLDISAVLTWAAARVFSRGRVRSIPLAAAVAVWIAAQTWVSARSPGMIGGSIGASISSALYAAAAFELWRTRSDRLRGLWPMILLLSLMMMGCAHVTVQFLSPGFDLSRPPPDALDILHFAGLIYSIGSATTLIMLLKDRSEAEHKAAALTDPLTGLGNRRAFEDRAQRSFARSMGDGSPASLLAFDLDNFKAVNDTFGHLVGDQVLQIFARSLARALRPADIAARMGGEEFAALLPGCDAAAALAIAARIRSSFQNDARIVSGRSVGATVSVGVATKAASTSFTDTLERADTALYRAKALGRNRVSVCMRDDDNLAPVTVLRIA